MQEDEDKKTEEADPSHGEMQGTEPEPESDPEEDTMLWHRQPPELGEVIFYYSHEGQPPRPAMVTATSETSSVIKLTVFDDQGKTYAAEASVEGTGQGQWTYRY